MEEYTQTREFLIDALRTGVILYNDHAVGQAHENAADKVLSSNYDTIGKLIAQRVIVDIEEVNNIASKYRGGI